MPQIRPLITQYIASFLSEAAQILSKSEKEALEHLLLTIEILARNEKLDIGFEWTEAMTKTNRLTRTQAVLGNTLHGLHDIQDAIDFDVKLLETSAKAKGGFAGVYVHGSKFRAVVDNPKGGTCFLASRPQALDAAIDRYHWHEEHGIPYGNIGRFVDEYKKRHDDQSIEQCLLTGYRLVSGMNPGDLKYPFTVDQIQKTIARYREVHGLPQKELPHDHTPVVATPPRVIFTTTPKRASLFDDEELASGELKTEGAPIANLGADSNGSG